MATVWWFAKTGNSWRKCDWHPFTWGSEKETKTTQEKHLRGKHWRRTLFKAWLTLSLRADMISIFEDYILISFLIFFIHNHITLANSLIIKGDQSPSSGNFLIPNEGPYKETLLLSKHVLLIWSEVYSMSLMNSETPSDTSGFDTVEPSHSASLNVKE